MESSDAEMGMVDCGVGTIVWVRRRNGSWWPGKILGPVELSASHLMSPRSGTPVKLLGREDASVDWYNLEKSKRVKPFRCGEFDECIERAEASQGMPPKKREKYARREDAILHALELEKQLLEKKYGGKSKGIIETSACENGNTDMELSVAHVSNIDEKSNTDVRPRLRGLQDLGNQGGSKYNINISSSNKHVDGSKKRSQQQEGNNNNEEKRRDRRRPLVQLLKNIPDLHLVDDMGVDDYAQPNTAAAAAAAAAASGSTEDTETDSSGTESLLSDTYDSMAAAALLDEGEDVEFIPKAEAAYEEEEESESEDSLQPIQKWQLKGKRNIRSRYTSFPWMKERRLLIDVEVGVQSGYQREHVPMISLMSKLNDQAIVGHPIPVETLEDSSSDFILLSASAAAADDDDEYLQPWRTARRTAKSRVYRPPTLDEYLVDDDYDEDEEEEEDDDDDGNNKRNHKSKKLRTSASSCNQKIRTLSSIGGNHHHHHHHSAAAAGEEDEEEEEMKPEALPTAVACIPVKLVFSRLHEELVARHQ